MTDMQPIRRKRSLLERAQSRFELDLPVRKSAAATTEQPVVQESDPAAVDPVRDAAGTAPQIDDTPLIRPSRPEVEVIREARASAPVPRARTAAPASRKPFLVGPPQVIDRRLLAEGGMVNPDDPVNALGEEFRLIKRQLLRGASADPRGRRILITSAQPDEGKTFTAINLALSLAVEQERSVLLVDGDFARGDVARRLGISSKAGLMDALVDPQIDIASCIVPTDIGNLAVLPAGQSHTRDTEMIGSARMLEILNRIQGDAEERILVFDSTPLLAASSAGALSSLCGQVVVVVRAEVTREAALRDAIGLIGQHNGLSLLLNRVRFTPEGRRFGSYYGDGG